MKMIVSKVKKTMNRLMKKKKYIIVKQKKRGVEV